MYLCRGDSGDLDVHHGFLSSIGECRISKWYDQSSVDGSIEVLAVVSNGTGRNFTWFKPDVNDSDSAVESIIEATAEVASIIYSTEASRARLNAYVALFENNFENFTFEGGVPVMQGVGMASIYPKSADYYGEGMRVTIVFPRAPRVWAFGQRAITTAMISGGPSAAICKPQLAFHCRP
jgi:hypothetical protein